MSPLRHLWQYHRDGLLFVLIMLVLLLLALFNGAGPARPQLTKKQARHLAAARDSAQRAGQLDTARARRATTHATTSYATGRRAEAHAAQLHAATHVRPHSLPAGADSSAAIADSLARVLAAY